MSIYKRVLPVSLPVLILCGTGLLVAVFLYLSISMTEKTLFSKEGPIWVFAAGMVPGLVVGLMQFILSWAEFSKISKFQKMKVKGILSTRDQEDYYRELIKGAKKDIQVLGVTASRFVSDFADSGSSRDDKKVLIAALQRGVSVRILVPAQAHLQGNDQSVGFPLAESFFTPLKDQYPNSFQVRYFDNAPIASVVRVDDDVVMGPVFTNQKSKHTPAVHAAYDSPLSESYMGHFDDMWPSARVF
ncbi:hypothetical protein [Herbaspirillum sp. NPDC087042]|uniref:hypothetical protein n=1 Tax=Herbaspirillum sp. NPDC087042 TaxID=3364004 RepID=UPI0038081E53